MHHPQPSDALAVFGGEPVRRAPWPVWPRADSRTEQAVLEVLRGGRWSIGGGYNGQPLFERRFAEAYAAYHGVAHCTPTVNGSTALLIALRALGVEFGDEVLVPGLTWVACPAAVIECGALPRLVDVDPGTLCMSVSAARAAITPRTKAIMLVHLYSALADLDAFVALSEETGVPLIEDASQAHGARWRGQMVGTFGQIGAFSLHDTKVLTAGEGGAAITDDPRLHDRLQQLRANGRRYQATTRPGFVEFDRAGDVLGCNGCLSELQAAILLDRLGHLDAENATRARNADQLCARLDQIGGVGTQTRLPQVDRATHFRFCLRFDRAQFAGARIGRLRDALAEELAVPVGLAIPLDANPLYEPAHATCLPPEMRAELDPRRVELPAARAARASCLILPHRVLLGSEDDTEDIARAIEKLKRQAHRLVD